MGTAARTRRMYLQLAATVVACAIFGLTAASAQQAAKVQSYAEVPPPTSIVLGLSIYLWDRFGADDELRVIQGSAHREAISANGAVVAGKFQPSSKHAGLDVFLWSKSGGFRDIGRVRTSNWTASWVLFVSNDGSVVIWKEVDDRKGDKKPNSLFRWSSAGGTKELVGMEGSFSVTGISADGSEVVGIIDGNGTSQGGFRWTQQGGWQPFPQMDFPLAVSADGAEILGTKSNHVIRWTQAGGAHDLGTLQTDAQPVKASADATEIVGQLDVKAHDNVPASSHAFVWKQAGGLQDLGTVGGGKNAGLIDVSADGTVVVGYFKDASDKGVYFVSPVADLVAKRQAELKREQTQEQAQAAAQAEEQAKSAAIAADQRSRYDKVIKAGRPAQLYSLAGDLEDEGRPDLAANLYQALIDKFPDDPYTAKAIDKKDAARAAAAQQQQAQDSAGQTAASAASPQAVEACLQQCSTTLSSCKSDAQNQHDGAVAKGLVGLLTRNSGSVSSAGTDSQNADDAKSACNDSYNSCSAACQ
jgi:uncharacterized membrane protein